jgi:hypothetical protein
VSSGVADPTQSFCHFFDCDDSASGSSLPPPATHAYPLWTETQVGNFRLASHAYIECAFTRAAQLALESQIPELSAIAAIKRCADRERRLRELAMLIAGEGGSLAIKDTVDDLLTYRRSARVPTGVAAILVITTA